MTPEDLLAWRKHMRFAQRAAAEALGVALPTYQAMERGTAFATGKPVAIDRRTALACEALAAGIETLTEWSKVPRIENGMRPVHPGEVLREEYLAPAGMSADGLATDLGIDPEYVAAVCAETSPVTPEFAAALVNKFGGDVKSWINLQRMHDMRCEEANASKTH